MNIRQLILKRYAGEHYIVRQKVQVLFWINILVIFLLAASSVINLTTPASTHPVGITVLNLALLAALVLATWLLLTGRYDLTVSFTIMVFMLRILAGCYLKLDSMAALGSNNNVYFMFALMALSMFFGKRSLIIFVFAILIAANISFIVIVYALYPTVHMNYMIGSGINILITLIIIFAFSFYMSRITDRALFRTQDELQTNIKLSGKLEHKVQELQSMYEEMEAMNEELIDTSKALMSSNQETRIFKELAEASTQGFVITDVNGMIQYINDAMKVLIDDGSYGPLTGKMIVSFYPDEYQKKLTGEITRHIGSHGYWTGELPVRAPDGSGIPTLQSFFIIRNKGEETTSYAILVTDLREQKRLESQLIQAQKMDAVGRLAGGIAHDFNNLLTAITGYSDLLLEKTGEGDPRTSEIREIKKAADMSSALTRHILSLARKQVIRPVPVNMNDEVREMHKILTRTIGENIELATELEGDLHMIRIDPVQVEQILLNLVINARDAMPGGGKLTIRTGNRHYSRDEARTMPHAGPGDYCCLTIEDTGTGIPRGVMDKIFEPFFTTKEPGTGTGLGLSTAFDIAVKNGGWITARSQEGNGSVFEVYFPAIPERAGAAEKKKTQERKPTGAGETVLVVEDQDEVRKFATAALSAHGYRVLDASTVAEALETLRSHGDDIDCIFSDYMLPDQSGPALFRKAIESRPSMRFVLCSGYTEQESGGKDTIETEYPFLAKPYTLNELLQAIYNALH